MPRHTRCENGSPHYHLSISTSLPKITIKFHSEFRELDTNLSSWWTKRTKTVIIILHYRFFDNKKQIMILFKFFLLFLTVSSNCPWECWDENDQGHCAIKDEKYQITCLPNKIKLKIDACAFFDLFSDINPDTVDGEESPNSQLGLVPMSTS